MSGWRIGKRRPYFDICDQSTWATCADESDAPDMWDELKLWAPMAAGAGNPIDWSGNGNTMTRYDGVTPNAGPTWERGEWQWPYAMELDGVDDYVSVQDSASLDITEAITISFWTNSQSGPSNSIMFSKGSSWSSGYSALVAANSGEVWFALDGEFVISNASLASVLDEWHHWMLSWDGTTMRIYYDGVLDNTKPKSGSIAPNDYDLWIGQEQTGGGRWPLDGLVDDFRIYGRPLSTSDLQHLYTDPTAAVRPAVTRVSFGGAIAYPTDIQIPTLSIVI